MSDAFWNDYSRLVARLMPPLAPGDGIPEAEIAAAEARLGLRLPTILREFYALVGGREDINHSFEHLVALDELSLSGGMLVFYEENQDVTFWGVKSDDAAPDPPVLRAYNEEILSWEPDSDHLSDFLVAMLLLQAGLGGMAFVAIGIPDSDRVSHASSDWEKIELREPWGHHLALLRDDQLLFYYGSYGTPGTAIVAGATAEDLKAVSDAFRMKWD